MADRQDVLGEALVELTAMTVRGLSRELSLTATSTLSTLERTGPRRLTDLAVAEGVTQPSMTAVVTQLEDVGYAERGRDAGDGRVVLVTITRDGRQHLRSLRRAHASALTTLIDKLPEPQLAALDAALPAIRQLLDLATGGGAA